MPDRPPEKRPGSRNHRIGTAPGSPDQLSLRAVWITRSHRYLRDLWL